MDNYRWSLFVLALNKYHQIRGKHQQQLASILVLTVWHLTQTN